MPWVRFERDFDWRVPGRRALIAYKAGMVKNVTTRCMEEAVAAGAGRRTMPPRRGKATNAAGS